MALDPSLFQTPDPLANFSIRFANSQQDFIADHLFVPQPIPQRQYKRYQYDLSNKRERPNNGRKSTKAAADLVDWGVTSSSGEAAVRRLAAQYDPQDVADFEPAVADLPTDAALTLTEQLLLIKERDAINKVAAANFASGLTTTLTAGTTRWGDGSSANPVNDVNIARAAIRSACGVGPNAMAMSWTMFERLKGVTAIVDRVKYTNPGAQVDRAILASLFSVQNIYICGGVSTTANEGAASQTLSDMWGNFVILFVEGMQGRRTMGFGYNFTINNGLYTKTWQDPQLGAEKPMQKLEMGWWYDLQPGAVDSFASGKFLAGYRIDNVY